MSSDPAPANWTAASPSTPAQPGIGTFILNVVVNETTSVTCVKLPSYDESNPVKGTKAARESILKLLAGKCDDISPLNFRLETAARSRCPPFGLLARRRFQEPLCIYFASGRGMPCPWCLAPPSLSRSFRA